MRAVFSSRGEGDAGVNACTHSWGWGVDLWWWWWWWGTRTQYKERLHVYKGCRKGPRLLVVKNYAAISTVACSTGGSDVEQGNKLRCVDGLRC